MSFELERAFGRILGLDYSQVNPGALAERRGRRHAGLAGDAAPQRRLRAERRRVHSRPRRPALRRHRRPQPHLPHHGRQSRQLSRQAAHRGQHHLHPGHGQPSAPATACRASTSWRARSTPTAIRSTSTRSASSPARSFSGNHGNPVTGWDDANGNPLTMWGSNDPALQGFFDLSGIPLPPGVTTANYQVTFEAIDPLYILDRLRRPLHRGPGRALRHAATPISVPNLVGGQRANPHRHRRRLRRGRLQRRHRRRGPAAPHARQRPVVRPAEPGGPDRLVHLPGARQSHLHRRHPGPRRNRRAHQLQGHALHRRLGRIRSRGRHGRRRRARPQRPGHRRNLAAGQLRTATTSCASASPTCAATAAPTTPTTAGCSTPTPSRPRACPPPAAPSSFTAWAFAWPTPSWSAASPRWSPASRPTRSPPSRRRAGRPGVTGSVDVEVDDQPVFYAAAIIPGGVSYDSGTGDALTLVTAPSNTVPIGVAASLHRHRAGRRISPPPAASPSSTPSPAARPRSPAGWPSARSRPPATAAPP